MPETPRTVTLTAELAAARAHWQEAGRVPGGAAGRREQDRIYAEEILERFAPLFAELPLHGAPPDLPTPRALVSVVGRRWQAPALLAAWMRPDRMLLLRTRAPESEAPSALALVSAVSGLALDHIEHQWVSDTSELAVYEEVRDFIARNRIDPDELAIDVSGGRQSMTIAAALAGFLAGARLYVVDCAAFDPDSGAPLPGAEFPRLIANPVHTLGDQELERIREAFNSGRYIDAESRAEDLAGRLHEPFEAEACRMLAAGYGAWHRFDFETARTRLDELEELLARLGTRPRGRWLAAVRAGLAEHIAAVKRLAEAPRRPRVLEDGLPHILNHLAAAERALAQSDLDDAVLLLYSTVERYVDLCLWTGFGLDDRAPDYGSLEGRIDWGRYHAVGEILFETYERRPPRGPLLYRNGLHLLAALDPGRVTEGDLGWLKGLGRMRNALAHGLVPMHPTEQETRRRLVKVHELLARAVGGSDALDAHLTTLRFPIL